MSGDGWWCGGGGSGIHSPHRPWQGLDPLFKSPHSSHIHIQTSRTQHPGCTSYFYHMRAQLHQRRRGKHPVAIPCQLESHQRRTRCLESILERLRCSGKSILACQYSAAPWWYHLYRIVYHNQNHFCGCICCHSEDQNKQNRKKFHIIFVQKYLVKTHGTFRDFEVFCIFISIFCVLRNLLEHGDFPISLYCLTLCMVGLSRYVYDISSVVFLEDVSTVD